MPSTLRVVRTIGLLAGVLSSQRAHADSDKLTLDAAIELAMRNNERIGLARANVSGAAIIADGAWNALKPNVSLSGTSVLQNQVVVDNFVVQQRTQSVASARVQQPVFRRGQFSARDASLHGRAAATAQLEFECSQLARDVVVAYIDVVRARSLMTLAEASAKRAGVQYTYAFNRVKAGSALKTVELLAQIDLKRAERQFVTAKRDVGRTEATFLRVVGIGAPELELPALQEPPSSDVARQGASNRADLVAIKSRIRQAESEREAAQGRKFWPRLDVEAGVDYYLPELNDRVVDWRVMGLLTIPLFQSGQEYTDIAVRKNQQRIAALQLGAQTKTAVEQFEIGAADFEGAFQAAELAEQQRDTAREHYSLVDKQFRLGAVTFLDVTNAQAALVEAENAFEVARIDRVRASYDLRFAVGMLDVAACTGSAPRRASKQPASTSPASPQPDGKQPPGESRPDI